MPHCLVYIPLVERALPPVVAKPLYFLLNLIAPLYFCLLSLIFKFYNFFLARKVVKRPSNPLLLESATSLGKKIRNREVKSVDIIEAYIKRLDEVNPVLNAIAYRNFDEARLKAADVDKQIEKMSDEELKQCAVSRPLLGLPFSMKDSISSKGKVVTCGYMSRKGAVVNETATVVQRIYDAGAILLAITTVPHTCMWIETYSAVFGRTNNPYDSRRTSGGSSGGEGAIHGAAAALIGIGSDLAGSIRIPSFFGGIYGLLTTSGVIPLDGHVPAQNIEHPIGKIVRIGPMTRFVEDVGMLTDLMSGNTVPASLVKPDEPLRIFFANGLTHMKFIEPISAEMRATMMMAADLFARKYKTSATEIDLPHSGSSIDIFMASVKLPGVPHMKYIVNSPFGDAAPCEGLLKQIAKYAVGQSVYSPMSIIQAFFDHEKPYDREQLKEAHEQREKWREDIIALLGSDGILLFPSFPTTAPFHNELLWKMSSIIHTGVLTVLRLPMIQCPMGLTADGIPTGVLIIGAPNSDRLVIRAAEELNEYFGGWKHPVDLFSTDR